MSTTANRIAAALVLLCGTGWLADAQAAAFRTFVASYGQDANPCSLAAPCRTFGAAVGATSAGGEVVALDSAGYGAVTIMQSIALTAPAGIYAGITVTSGNGVTIAAGGVAVTLTGLTINNGGGGSNGVAMTSGSALTVVHCIVSGFASGAAIAVPTAANVRIADTLLRDNYHGVDLSGGASADIARLQVFGGTGYAIHVVGGVLVGPTARVVEAGSSAAGTSTSAVVTDSVLSGNFGGVDAFANVAGTSVKVSVIRTTISNNVYGVVSDFLAGSALATISESLVTGNTAYGFYQSGGSGAVLKSLGNNTVEDNVIDEVGTVTTAATK